MQIFLGPFHPFLEASLAAEIQRLKSSDPLAPLLLLVPSDALRRHLMKSLTLHHHLNLMNLSILTFHQLSRKLVEEKTGIAVPPLQDDLFFEETLRLLIHQSPSAHSFSTFCKTKGGVGTLWKTLRDLKDGCVNPDNVIQALKEGLFGLGISKGKLFPLFELYRQIKTVSQERLIWDYGDLAVLATRQVETSILLKQCRRILYYGFYDLTQIQIDLFHEISRHHPSSLFFPLIQHQAGWSFSMHFFERYVEGLVSDSSDIKDLTADADPDALFPHVNLFTEGVEDLRARPATQPSIKIMNCFNLREEVKTAAKEIVRLTSDEGVLFSEIGIVARDMAPYLMPIKDLFPKHAIPIASACSESLIQYPLAKQVLLLTQLLSEDFPRALLIEWVSAPFFRIEAFCPEGSLPCPDLWDLLTRQAKITKGIDSWRRLEQDEPGDGTHLSEQRALLWLIFSRLHQDLHHLPSAASWSDYSARWEDLLAKYLGLSSSVSDNHPLAQEERIALEIQKILTRLSGLDRVSESVTRDDYIAAFQRGLESASLPIADANIAGVSVMSAMTARGISFRFLFLLGLNEGHFPRSIREDPVLQDHDRHILEADLGYKVGEKLSGYDEERLLLNLLAGSAKEKLSVLYHRTDKLGASATPSWYLNELRQAFRDDRGIAQEQRMPHGLIERHSVSPYDRDDLLLPSELAIYAKLCSQNPHPILQHLPFSMDLYTHGENALKQLEGLGPLTAYDGLITASETHWENILQKGISPTRLEKYARCPYQFFTTQLLKLAPARDKDRAGLATSDIGEICHKILKDFYSSLVQEGYFKGSSKGVDLEEVLQTITDTVFTEWEAETEIPYPLVWEETKDQIVALLGQVIQIDLKELGASGFQPAAFEVNCRERIEATWPEFFGRIDRIDFHPQEGKIRVIDYKVTLRKSPQSLEKNLLLSALRGERLQAPIYLRFAEKYSEEWDENEGSQTTSLFYHLVPKWSDGPLVISSFPEEGWEGETGTMLKETISRLFQTMSSGQFFMKPGNHCKLCDVVSICRLHHRPSRLRLEKDPTWKQFQDLQKKKKPRASSPGKTAS